MIHSVNLQMRVPFFEDADGTLMATENKPTEIPWRESPDCDHSETACEQCAEQWAQDWNLISALLLTDEGVLTAVFDDPTGRFS